MNEFAQYVSTETRKPRLVALRADSYNALTAATDARKSLESKLEKAKAAEIQYRDELQVVVDRINDIQTNSSMPVEEALKAASEPPTLEKKEPPLPKEPLNLDVTLDEEDETAEMTYQENSNVSGQG